MRILITGGVGFIGSNLINYLSKKRTINKIIVVDNFSKSNLKNLKKDLDYKYYANFRTYKKSRKIIEIVNVDISNYNAAISLTKEIDYVVHLAAESGVDTSINYPQKAFKTNVASTFNYLEASRINNVKNFLFASSCAVFGDTRPPHNENISRKPISPYGSSKLTIESFCETYANVYEINTSILRFSNAYGSFSKHKKSVVAKFIQDILSNKPIVINGNGNITRDFVHVSDICDAIFKCLITRKNNCKIYHVATGKETSIKDLVKYLRLIFKKYKINTINIEYAKERVGDILKNYSSISKIKKELKWKNKIDLKQGLEETIKWYINGK